jgi:hypothetical protein
MVKRLLAAVSILIWSISPPAQAQAFTIDTSFASPLTGLWWNAGESGWGATITQQSHIMFVTMFVYDAAGNPVWYTVTCTIDGANCVGDMLRVRGGTVPTTTWDGSGINVSRVGSMTLNFTSNDAGSMSYMLDGISSTRQIARQVFGPPAPNVPGLAGQWQGAIIETRSNCSQAQNNGARATYGQYDIGMGVGAAGAISITLSGVTGLQCSYSGNFTINGARLLANGILTCSDGKRGSWRSTDILVTAKAMSLQLAVQLDTTETCTIVSILGGSRP